MRKFTNGIYAISVVLVLFLLAFFCIHERVDEQTARAEEICEVLTDYEYTCFEDETAPQGIVQEYTWEIDRVPSRNGCIAFYIVHQEVDIYIDDELLYSLHPNDGNVLAQTVGCDWAKVFLYQNDLGKELRIRIYPIYETSIDKELTIYYGSYDTVCGTVIKGNIFILLMGLMAIIIGLAFIIFVLANIKNQELDRSIAFLGIFSIFAGLWKICDMVATPLIFKDSLTLSAFSILSLYMMVVPYIFFIRNQFAQAKHRFWDTLCIGCSAVSILIVILQLSGIADLRQSLIFCHLMAIIVITSIMTLLILETRHTKLSSKLKITFVCCVLCLLGTLLDMVVYYRFGASGNMMYCLLAFLIYAILMGCMALKEAHTLLERGKEAKKFEHLAMHDALTGLYNRAFYAQYLKKHNLQREDCFIIMLDINDLKKCNDTLGHDYGDRLLLNCTNLIEQAFMPQGKCIRMGGDEFCVILRHANETICKNCLKRFDELIAAYNEAHPSAVPVHIAYGYANFNANKDFDFGDTLRRADKKMYQNKMQMKADN